MSTIKTWEERLPAILNTPEEIANARDAEITELREALKVAQEENTANMSTCKGIISGLTTERDALQAKLDAIEKQEPPKHYTVMGLDQNGVRHIECVFDVYGGKQDEVVIEYYKTAPVAPAQPVNELVEALREAAAFIHAVNIGKKPEVRYPLADELDGFAAILANAKAARQDEDNGCPDCKVWMAQKDWLLKSHNLNGDLRIKAEEELAALKAAKPLTKEQVEKVLQALWLGFDASRSPARASIFNKAIEIMKGVRG